MIFLYIHPKQILECPFSLQGYAWKSTNRDYKLITHLKLLVTYITILIMNYDNEILTGTANKHIILEIILRITGAHFSSFHGLIYRSY